jgi:hypothetical protein
MPQAITVIPIVPTYDFTGTIQFVDAASGLNPSTMPDPNTADQIIAQVRDSPNNGNLLAVATAWSPASYQVSFTIAGSATAGFPSSGVYIDFVRLDNATWSPLPVSLRWPVRPAITTNPTLSPGVPYYTEAQLSAAIAAALGAVTSGETIGELDASTFGNATLIPLLY